MTDADLVRQTRNGQPSAYEVLVRRWSARVIGYVRSKVASQEVAEDIAQDCLLKAFRSLDTLAEPSKFGSWLLSIAHRASLDWLKASARSEIRFGEINNEKSGDSNEWVSKMEPPGVQCERREEQNNLHAEIASLPETLREVLMIYYYDKVTYNEIAEMLGVSSATINARLTKARNLLRERLCENASDARSLR